MKKTIIRLLVFLLPIFLVWGSIEYFYRTVPNNYTQKSNYLLKHSNEIEVLLFGTSHCFFGLNPDYFSKNAYNLSNISQTLYFDALLFEHYESRMPNLKQVVFCIEYTNLSQKDNTDEDTYRKYYYEQYMGLNVPIVSDFDPHKYSLALTRSLSKSLEIIGKYHKDGSIVDCKENGWAFTYKKMDRTPPEKEAKVRARNHEDGSVDFSLNTKRLENIIAICKKRKIEVVIVSLPLTKIYTHYVSQTKLKRIFETCELLDHRHDNVRYLNLVKDDRFADEDFYDSDHLNDEGATKASKIVSAFLEKK